MIYYIKLIVNIKYIYTRFLNTHLEINVLLIKIYSIHIHIKWQIYQAQLLNNLVYIMPAMSLKMVEDILLVKT